MNNYLKLRQERYIECDNQYILCLFVINFVSIIIADLNSLLSYSYALLILLVASLLICRKEIKKVLFTYHFLLLFAIVFFMVFKAFKPEYYGLTGATDDGLYYYQLLGGRGIGYDVRLYWIDMHPFVYLLKVLYPFKIYSPLNIIVVNLIFGAFLPIYVGKLAILITNNINIGRTSYWLTLLCPFMLYYSCILMRESIMALMVCAGLCCFLQKKYIPLIICASVIAFIRMGTLPFLLCGILVLYRFMLKQKIKSDIIFFSIIVLIIVGVYFSMDMISVLSGGKLEGGLIREASFIGFEDSTIGAIMGLPFPLNIVVSTAFFLYLPLFTIPMAENGYYSISSIFIGFSTPIFFFFIWRYIYNAVCIALFRNEDNAKKIFFIVIIFATLLGTISLQFRHKSVLFPVLCILAAYGKFNYNIKYGAMSSVLAIITIGIEVFLAVMKVL